jgi:hypothetical protein
MVGHDVADTGSLDPSILPEQERVSITEERECGSPEESQYLKVGFDRQLTPRSSVIRLLVAKAT